MKTVKITTAILAIIFVAVFGFLWKKSDAPAPQPSSILGCYAATIGKDVYTLTILKEDRGIFEGKLSFKNFQKDSSRGTYNGTYRDGILLGDYSFQSEGMDSVMQVAFKKSGYDFIRGVGDLNKEGNKFADVDNITFTPAPLSLFKKSECKENAKFRDSELGIEFEYPAGQNGYVLEERVPVNGKNDLEKILTLIRTEDKIQGAPQDGEGPPVISISVFSNLSKEKPRVWADKNSEYSNINLKMGEVLDIFVDGQKAIRYTADGLYASENIVITRDNNAYLITGQFIDRNSDIYRDFEPILSSIRFID